MPIPLPPRKVIALGVGGVMAATLSACGGTQDDAAARVAVQLLDAAAERDGAAACGVLADPTKDELEQSSGTACEKAVLEEDLGGGDGEAPVSVEVFDSMAQVGVGSQTVFLSRYDGRWRVVAAACTRVAGRPYDCSIGLP